MELRSDGLGYVSVDKFIGEVGEDTDAYAADLADRITALSGETCINIRGRGADGRVLHDRRRGRIGLHLRSNKIRSLPVP